MNKQPAPRRSGRRGKVKDERPNMSGCEASAEEETGETEEQEPVPGSSFQDEEQPGTSTDPGKRKRGSSTLERVCTCNECKQNVETRFHCTVCEDYDLCITCYSTKRHEHKMEKLGLGLDDESGSSASASTQSPGDSRRLSIQRCIQSLVHACQCRNANCSLPSCQKMKRVVQHTKACKRKTNGGCPICKQLIALCCYHAKHCQENKCPVPFCLNIKHKLRQQQLQHRLQQAQMLRRRMASMQRMGAGAVTGA